MLREYELKQIETTLQCMDGLSIAAEDNKSVRYVPLQNIMVILKGYTEKTLIEKSH